MKKHACIDNLITSALGSGFRKGFSISGNSQVLMLSCGKWQFQVLRIVLDIVVFACHQPCRSLRRSIASELRLIGVSKKARSYVKNIILILTHCMIVREPMEMLCFRSSSVKFRLWGSLDTCTSFSKFNIFLLVFLLILSCFRCWQLTLWALCMPGKYSATQLHSLLVPLL